MISDKDSAQLTALQDLVQKWRATILEYEKTAANNNEQTRNKISDIQAVYQRGDIEICHFSLLILILASHLMGSTMPAHNNHIIKCILSLKY